MGLYNFKAQFVPKILGGEKTHTIRATRANPDKPGNTVHLYTGNRTKKSRLLMRAICTKVQAIEIREDPRPLPYVVGEFHVLIDEIELDYGERNQLAMRDGFANFGEMMQFWEGRLPFKGHIIHWRKP